MNPAPWRTLEPTPPLKRPWLIVVLWFLPVPRTLYRNLLCEAWFDSFLIGRSRSCLYFAFSISGNPCGSSGVSSVTVLLPGSIRGTSAVLLNLRLSEAPDSGGVPWFWTCAPSSSTPLPSIGTSLLATVCSCYSILFLVWSALVLYFILFAKS